MAGEVFLITNQDALKPITVTDVVAIDTAEAPGVRRASKEWEIHRKNKQAKERSSSAAFPTVLKPESLKLKFGKAQFDSWLSVFVQTPLSKKTLNLSYWNS